MEAVHLACDPIKVTYKRHPMLRCIGCFQADRTIFYQSAQLVPLALPVQSATGKGHLHLGARGWAKPSFVLRGAEASMMRVNIGSQVFLIP